MAAPTVLELAEAIADALTDVSPLNRLTIEPRYVFSFGGDACIDIYPATPAEGNLTFAEDSRLHWFTIRLRVPTSDEGAVQEWLYNARNPTGPWSVRAALFADGTTLAGLVDAIDIPDGSPTGFRLYEDAGAGGLVRYLGEEWRVGLLVGGEDFES